ncbi:DNA-binding transcriptional regulator, LysR family [Paenibacillus tianmuensis]|uniref:DNA-binding transcriptional regulator, LysR family n=1 Tax=Paenibacillus tianmuensis TaxID=624147 RepID=A0A1G4R7X0_9BACL|nr:LysR family transcriptional regulator [Paenibacillus tianmuensis]SCW52900.1 DNA-binding transcriptional regulator, LysR family [Paenibacillus tianmuensis]
MELQQLRYFQTVARLEHMTQAAEELNITQPALSRTISRLEEDIGVPLFERKGRHIRLNRYGEIFLAHLERSFLELDQAKKKINDMAQLGNRSVSIATTNVSIFPSLVSSFLRQYPDIRIRQYLRSDINMYQLLEQGEIDMCISSEPIEGPDIQWDPLFSEELLLLVPREERFVHRQEIRLIEVASERFISGNTSYDTSNWLEKLCRQAGFAPKISFEGNDSVVIGEMVSLGLGISFIPKPLWEKFSEILKDRLHVLKITEPHCTMTTGISRITNRYMPTAADTFYSFAIHRTWDQEEGF